MAHPNILDKEKTALVIVDFQEAFRDSIPDFGALAENISRVVQGFRVLGVPIIVTEQYPRGLGHTAKEILEVLPPDLVCIEKSSFSSCGAGGFINRLNSHGSKQVLLCGLETHICVNQTAHDLLDQGLAVHILEDSVGSRTEADKKTGLSKMKASGAVASSIEMALFELMGDSKHQKFKEIQNLIK
ncbi:MAG: hydrolase [Pyrinomonadaceae bacterium]|nr:hydrolase [Pyrinomonadaceae bacterium]